MKAGDLYRMPAWNEGFGTPMLEVLGCGLPVIANKAEPAFREWIKPPENGALCDIKRPQEWAKAIENIALLPDTRRHDIAAHTHKNARQSAMAKTKSFGYMPFYPGPAWVVIVSRFTLFI